MSDQSGSGTVRDPFENVGDCPACGTTVRYSGYVPRIYLCADCGGEKPHAEGVVERDGRLYYEPDNDQTQNSGSDCEEADRDV